MSKYRKKPIVIEAFQLSVDPWPDWFHDKHTRNEIVTWEVDSKKPNGDIMAEILTLEGKMRADPGDYIIQGINGEVYPCKPDIFEKTYDKERGE